jgi:8-oxo-dGTP pyrophosphatase MutT (NUDIX family)
MKSPYRVYFDDRSLFILHTTNKIHIADALNIGFKDDSDILYAIKEMDERNATCVAIRAEDTAAAFSSFKSKFQFIQAGGGLVKNEKDEYLFIFRRGKWDLPKGKLDEGETISECAVREVQEETGLVNVLLQDHLVDTWHVYHERGKFILKESVWFNMSCHSAQELKPQTEEDIHDIKWLRKEEWITIYDNTFPSIKDVLKAAS